MYHHIPKQMTVIFFCKKTTLSLNKLAEPLWWWPTSFNCDIINLLHWFVIFSRLILFRSSITMLDSSVRIFSKDFVQWRQSLLHATAYQGCLWSSVRPFTQTLHSNVNMIPKTRGLNSYELFTSIDYHLCAGLRRHALLFN